MSSLSYIELNLPWVGVRPVGRDGIDQGGELSLNMKPVFTYVLSILFRDIHALFSLLFRKFKAFTGHYMYGTAVNEFLTGKKCYGEAMNLSTTNRINLQPITG